MRLTLAVVWAAEASFSSVLGESCQAQARCNVEDREQRRHRLDGRFVRDLVVDGHGGRVRDGSMSSRAIAVGGGGLWLGRGCAPSCCDPAVAGLGGANRVDARGMRVRRLIDREG
jgi:hypothetical protein